MVWGGWEQKTQDRLGSFSNRNCIQVCNETTIVPFNELDHSATVPQPALEVPMVIEKKLFQAKTKNLPVHLRTSLN